VLVFTMEGK